MLRRILPTLTALALVGCATKSTLDPATHCARMTDAHVAANEIGIASGDARVTSASLVAAYPMKVDGIAVTPAAPAHCKLLGQIDPIDPSAPKINFQVNLPADWNGRMLQFGGGGFNGLLITGQALPPAARLDQPGPLTQGYVTVGTDSGHQNAPNIALQAFALNPEALENFAHAAYKKVHDVAERLIKRYYGSYPNYRYFVGSSEGGREGLVMAQRYPDDFDGIFSRVPVLNWTGLMHTDWRIGMAQLSNNGAGWIAPDKVKMIADHVLTTCDTRDGVKDERVYDYGGCMQTLSLQPLRCTGGGEGASCLSDPQLRAVGAMYSTYSFPFPLANGVRSYPRFGVGGEAAAGSGPVGGWVSWQTGTAVPTVPASATSSRSWQYGSGAIAHFYMQDASADVTKYEPEKHKARILEISNLMDATNPDLSRFYSRGGKLIMLEYMADYAQSPYAGIEYAQAVSAKLGRPRTEQFMRLYVAPGVDHVGLGAPAYFPMLDTLTAWVEKNQAPGNLELVEQARSEPYAVTKAIPMCRWPQYPRYKGSGDAAKAESYGCVSR